ncbi:MAG TPA: segregation/condensation protein A [Candidatus Paceibacterota bacterium]|nr:segregation/condensation protein A [Candidatus Paceibacterota bacterium]
MTYELALNEYKGPLDKLLELVEEKKLEITRVSLSEVTADFLDYLKKMEAEKTNHGLIADFLAVASRLILIKSKTLLPALELSAEEESDIKNLEARLKIYAELKGAQKNIKSLWNEQQVMATREFLSGMEAVFYPPEGISKEDLAPALERILEELQRFLKPVETIKIEVINLKAKIEDILKKLEGKPMGLRGLRNENSRSELVVLFLAILHMIKEELIHVEQETHFAEIQIARK